MNNTMIKIDERRQIQIPIDNGGVINIVIPHANYSIYEADEICKKYRQCGYHCGYLWRKEYAPNIDPSDGRKINKAAVMAIFPDKTSKRYEMIKYAASDNGITTTSVHRSLKLGVALSME